MIRKSDKPQEHADFYQPIFLLPILAKLLERLLHDRNKCFVNPGGLSGWLLASHAGGHWFKPHWTGQKLLHFKSF